MDNGYWFQISKRALRDQLAYQNAQLDRLHEHHDQYDRRMLFESVHRQYDLKQIPKSLGSKALPLEFANHDTGCHCILYLRRYAFTIEPSIAVLIVVVLRYHFARH